MGVRAMRNETPTFNGSSGPHFPGPRSSFPQSPGPLFIVSQLQGLGCFVPRHEHNNISTYIKSNHPLRFISNHPSLTCNNKALLIINFLQWLIGKLGPKYILDKTIDGATPLHMAAGMNLLQGYFLIL